MTLHIFRVAVRGKFKNLSMEKRAALLEKVEEHDFTQAEFTKAGTLMYEKNLGAFSFRYEVRESGDGAEALAVEKARALATRYLKDHGIGHGELRITASDMADVWREPKQ